MPGWEVEREAAILISILVKRLLFSDNSQKPGSESLRRASAGPLLKVRFPPVGARGDIPSSAEKRDFPPSSAPPFLYLASPILYH
jgi:hypothetical protein